MDIDIVKQFGSLANFRNFLSEKINDGAEISRGKTSTETSKQEKKEKKISKEVDKKANGSAKEVHYDTSPDQEAPQAEMPPGPPVDPTAAPGSQISIGKKDIDNNEADAEKAVSLKLSGKKEKLNLKPKITVKDDGLKR